MVPNSLLHSNQLPGWMGNIRYCTFVFFFLSRYIVLCFDTFTGGGFFVLWITMFWYIIFSFSFRRLFFSHPIFFFVSCFHIKFCALRSGRIYSGMGVIQRMGMVTTDNNDKPKNPVTIHKARSYRGIPPENDNSQHNNNTQMLAITTGS